MFIRRDDLSECSVPLTVDFKFSERLMRKNCLNSLKLVWFLVRSGDFSDGI